MQRVLIIDDEPDIRATFVRFLSSRGFDASAADSGEAGLELARRGAFVLALCDVSMPGMSGIDTARRLVQIDPDIAVLMVTGVDDARLAVEAMALGASDYLVKPVGLSALETAVTHALHKRRLLIDQKRVERLIREEVAEHTAELRRDQARLRDLTFNVTEALISAMEAMDGYLRGHSQRVSAMAAAVAEQLGLDLEVVEEVRLAARLHDVGMIGVREGVLNKPSALTREESAHVRDHVRIGLDILRPLTHLGEALTFIRDHHEHWDGTGYPASLSGDGISIGGRILAACDTFDAMTSARAYQRRMSSEDALEYMRSLVGTALDGTVLDALDAVVHARSSLTFMEVAPEAKEAGAMLEGTRVAPSQVDFGTSGP